MSEVCISIPDELLKKLDEARGDVSRSRFVMRSIEDRLRGIEKSETDDNT